MRDIYPEPVFANLLKSSGIDFQLGGQIRLHYLTYRPARLHRLAESILGLLKRLQTRAQHSEGNGYLFYSILEDGSPYWIYI